MRATQWIAVGGWCVGCVLFAWFGVVEWWVAVVGMLLMALTTLRGTGPISPK